MIPENDLMNALRKAKTAGDKEASDRFVSLIANQRRTQRQNQPIQRNWLQANPQPDPRPVMNSARNRLLSSSPFQLLAYKLLPEAKQRDQMLTSNIPMASSAAGAKPRGMASFLTR